MHNSHVLTPPLEGREPTACTKSRPRLEKLSEERWHRGFIVLCMHNPCDLGQKDIYVLDKLHVLELCVPQLLAATTYDKGHNMI